MRLDDALKNGHDHAINRTGRRPIEFLAGDMGSPGRPNRRVWVRAVLDENPLHVEPESLYDGPTEAGAEAYLAQSQDTVDPDAWYPFDTPAAL